MSSSSPAQDYGAANLFNIVIPIFDRHQQQPFAILTVSPNFPQLAKEGPLPASKSSIESLQTVKVTQEEECAICMMEYGEEETSSSSAGGESLLLLAKEMPCKHKFHADCVNKWLGIRGSCPVCRFEMPVDDDDDEEEEKARDDNERDDEEGGLAWQMTFFIHRSRIINGSGLEDGLASEDMDI